MQLPPEGMPAHSFCTRDLTATCTEQCPLQPKLPQSFLFTLDHGVPVNQQPAPARLEPVTCIVACSADVYASQQSWLCHQESWQ